MDTTHRLSCAFVIVALHATSVSAQRPAETNLRENGCTHEGLIATGLLASSFFATQSTYEKNDTLPTGFRLLCEQQQLIFEHQEWAGTSSENAEHWYEYWGVVATVRDTLPYNTLQFTFSHLGGTNTVAVLTINNREAAKPSVLFAIERWYLTKKYFGRITYVAPQYVRDIPVPRKE